MIISIINQIDWIEIFKIGVPVVAAISSIISIIIVKRNLKKQLRISKLEELIELVKFLSQNYYVIFYLYKAADRYFVTNGDEDASEAYSQHISRVREYLNYDKVIAKLTRVDVLANSYLPNAKLKYEILCLYDLIWNISDDAYGLSFTRQYENFKDGYPEIQTVNKVCANIEKDLIEEMGLGYKGINGDNFKSYRDTIFKPRLKNLDTKEKTK